MISRFHVLATFTIAIVASWFCLDEARGDPFVFVLANGGRVEGEWVNMKHRNVKTYVVKTRSGGQITLDRSQVKGFVRVKAGEMEYDHIAPTKFDTVDGHWEMAEWCRQRQLTEQRARHLKRIIELDPDHAKARYGLGYHQVDGRWVTREGWRKEQGLVEFRGRWRTTQEVEMAKRRQKNDAAERDWIATIRRLRKMLATERAPQAYQELTAIEDPHAIRALREAMQREQVRAVKLAYIKALGNIRGDGALVELVNTSLDDPDIELFHACLDEICDDAAARVRVTGAYIKGLKNVNNVRINRSAKALERIGTKEAIGPLIDSLVTTHKVMVSQGSSGPGTPVSNTFIKPGANDSGSAFSASPSPSSEPNPLGTFTTGSQTQIVPVQSRNSEVLQALVSLSGASFGFNQQAWKNWYDLEKRKSAKKIR